MFKKLGEATQITEASLQTAESALSDPEIKERFAKFAKELKKIAPKANDFLYFSCIMLHSAEASLLNQDGSPKKLSNGKTAEAHWDKRGDSWKWVSNDPSIMPYKNANLDIFPEEELLKAYKKWIGKPLCIDHKSSSVDFIRGVIVDTYYDRAHKRVIGLCALDKQNYPDLARKVSSGYAASVSMGTGVGRAVCTDCGVVARVEQDFCNHMRTKSAYGEINLDLSPIELSIVVNGADPLAKIKHVIASANHLNDYAASKQQEIVNLSEADNDKVTQIKEEIVDGIKRGLNDLVAQFEAADLSSPSSSQESEEMNDVASEADASLETTASENLTSENVFEDNDTLIETFNNLKSSIEQKLATIQDDFSQLIKLNTESREMKMEKKSYYQGTEEPKPGTQQYPADPLNEQSRMESGHMKNTENLGSPEGLHPGDLEKKKMLARAQADERAERRKTALVAAKQSLATTKEAYFQGTEEPKPGKQQYAVDPGEAQSRKDNKHMQGQPPFPGVGSVDGLHPSPASADQKDELKRKQMLSRASLKAKFVKAANVAGDLDRAKSQWQVFANDKLVLSASVDDITAGRSDVLYDVVATRDFGTKMLEKVKEVGIEKAASLYKSAQAAPETAAAPAPAPAPAPEAAPDMGAPELLSADSADKGGDGDPGENADKLVEDLSGLAEELKTKVSDLKEGIGALNGEKAEMADAPAAELPTATASLHKMRVELNAALIQGMRRNAEDLSSHLEEIGLIQDLYSTDSVHDANREYVDAITQDAVAEAKQTLAETNELFQAFVKYAKGTEAMMKRAEIESKMTKTANPDMELLQLKDMALANDEMPSDMMEEELSDAPDTEKEPHQPHHLTDEELEALLKDDSAAEDMEMTPDMGMVEDNDMNNAQMKKEELAQLPPGTKLDKLEVTADDLSTREGRTAYRAKLAAESTKFNPMLGDAHKLCDSTTDLDIKPSGDLAKVETIEEINAKMMDLAKAAPKVRKEAMEIVALVKAGKIAAEDVDQLVQHGVDAAAVQYFKTVWAQSNNSELSNEFAKEHVKAQAAEEIATHKAKLARAYELAYQMVERGLCGNDQTVITAQVDEIMSYNDEAFKSLKKVIARHAPLALRKEASRLPNVGSIGSGDVFSQEPVESDDLFSGLSRAFANRRY